MKISSQEEYGLRCLLQVARDGVTTPVPISEIAAREGLSVEYVGKLLMKLRKGELVSSVRGKAGGYTLAQPATEISLLLVLQVLSDPVFDRSYCARFSGTEETCVHADNCGIRPIWAVVNQFLDRTLSNMTIADVLSSEADAIVRLKQVMIEQAEALSNVIPVGPPNS
ncbi:MAG: Rrf2 family transcriptional regulator [Planctomycetota bacterium]